MEIAWLWDKGCQWEQIYYEKKDRDLNFHGRKDGNGNRRGMPTSCENEISIDLSQDDNWVEQRLTNVIIEMPKRMKIKIDVISFRQFKCWILITKFHSDKLFGQEIFSLFWWLEFILKWHFEMNVVYLINLFLSIFNLHFVLKLYYFSFSSDCTFK